MGATDLFEQAVAAAKANRAEEAENLLRQVLDAHPTHEQAWLWLASVVADVHQTVECLHRVLALNPHNDQAKEWLALALEAMPDKTEEVVEDEDRAVARLGKYLLAYNLVTAEQLNAALLVQEEAAKAKQHRRIGEILVEQGVLSAEVLNFALHEQQRDIQTLFW